MSESIQFPKYSLPGVETDEGLFFQDGEDVIEIELEHSEIIWNALSLANGFISRNEIIDQLIKKGYEKQAARAVLDDLENLGITGENTRQYQYFHRYTKNIAIHQAELSADKIQEITTKAYPQPDNQKRFNLPEKPGEIAHISKERHSTRNFEKKPMKLHEIGEVLANSYSFERSPIPSAGGLYGLKIFTILKESGEIPSGRFEYDPVDNVLCKSGELPELSELAYAFNEESALHGAPTIIVIAGNLDRHSEKYGDRGYRYVHLEAGQATQNIILTASELGLGSLVYGGFIDDEVESMLQMKDHTPMVAIAVGHESKEQKLPDYALLAQLESHYVGIEKPVDSVSVNSFDGIDSEVKYHFASAHYKKPSTAYSDVHDERYTAGTARSINMALIKATAEAVERYQSGRYRIDISESAQNLRIKWLHPNTIRPLTDEQLEGLPHLDKFSPEKQADWVTGTTAIGAEKLAIPIDLVYYPLNKHVLNRQPYADADSSGVAAHITFEEASSRATYELIERDALMRNWLQMRSPDIIHDKFLSNDLAKRKEYWDEKGFDLFLLDMSDRFPVVQAILVNQNERYPYFVNGAAASSTYEESMSKSFEEAELGLLHALNDAQKPRVHPQDIRTPGDHAVFYYYPENKKYIEWLWGGNIADKLNSPENFIDPVEHYDPVLVELSHGDEPLKVVRAIVPNLVPINFGTGNEYYSHINSGVLSKPSHVGVAPHFFA